jgi:predicted DNA-binding WGR domain protein
MRRFEYVAGTSSKFWTVAVEGSTFVVIFGKIGTAGQRKDKAFPSEEAARKEMDKKIAEKLREGYAEVGASAAASSAPAGVSAPAAPVKPVKPVLPPRVQAVTLTADKVEHATEALRALEQSLGGRSFHVGRVARRARRALEGIAGCDPQQHPSLLAALDGLLGRVTAAAGPRLSLRLCLGLLSELDVAAFERALDLWHKAHHPPAVVTVLLRQVEQLSDPEVGLRVGLLLIDRPGHGGGPEAGWARRWRTFLPHLVSHLKYRGSTLADYLHALDPGDDVHLSRRISQMSATGK